MVASLRGREPGSRGTSNVGRCHKATWLRTLVFAWYWNVVTSCKIVQQIQLPIQTPSIVTRTRECIQWRETACIPMNKNFHRTQQYSDRQHVTKFYASPKLVFALPKSVGIATSYGLDCHGSIPGSDKILFSVPQHPDRMLVPLSLLFMGIGGFPPVGGGGG
jgi:hypothetical protein